jgi:hypothetical protein
MMVLADTSIWSLALWRRQWGREGTGREGMARRDRPSARAASWGDLARDVATTRQRRWRRVRRGLLCAESDLSTGSAPIGDAVLFSRQAKRDSSIDVLRPLTRTLTNNPARSRKPSAFNSPVLHRRRAARKPPTQQ